MKYKIGDYIRFDCNGRNGSGYIRNFDGGLYAVEIDNKTFDEYNKRGITFHSCLNKIKHGYGWNVDEPCILGLVKNPVHESIKIYRNDNVVTAKMGDKVAIAKCHPDDEFDFAVGAKLAIERLFNVEQKKEEPGFKVGDKVMIVNSSAQYTTHPNWFIYNKVDPDITARYCYGRSFENGLKGKIVAIHKDKVAIECKVQDGNHDTLWCYGICLIGIKGIKKI